MVIRCTKPGYNTALGGVCGSCQAEFEADKNDFENLILTVIDCPQCGENNSVQFYDAPKKMLNENK